MTLHHDSEQPEHPSSEALDFTNPIQPPDAKDPPYSIDVASGIVEKKT